MNELSCAQFGELVDELALGVLPGPKRAQALAHANNCDTCATELRRLAAVADGLLELIPGREPPADFENRVLHRLGLTARQRGRRSWLLRAAVAAAVATVFALGGFALGTTTTPAPVASIAQPALLSAPLTTDGRVVGHIYAATATPSWIYMGIDTDHGTGTVSCQLQQRNGHLTTLGTFDVKEGYGTWGAPSPIDPTSVVAARVVAADGTVLATAAFGT
ncbi:MAG: hypothetical protein ABI251_02950 [Mycobacteriaceae bacterium]